MTDVQREFSTLVDVCNELVRNRDDCWNEQERLFRAEMKRLRQELKMKNEELDFFEKDIRRDSRDAVVFVTVSLALLLANVALFAMI